MVKIFTDERTDERFNKSIEAARTKTALPADLDPVHIEKSIEAARTNAVFQVSRFIQRGPQTRFIQPRFHRGPQDLQGAAAARSVYCRHSESPLPSLPSCGDSFLGLAALHRAMADFC